ncbi:MAG: hypothetical protein B7X09_00055 [Acidiphilium sp. 21-66-27]|nr:MAG: hypothetical protein B7X09_00055 [Acidiphilium sp. 21-66-27]
MQQIEQSPLECLFGTIGFLHHPFTDFPQRVFRHTFRQTHPAFVIALRFALAARQHGQMQPRIGVCRGNGQPEISRIEQMADLAIIEPVAPHGEGRAVTGFGRGPGVTQIALGLLGSVEPRCFAGPPDGRDLPGCIAHQPHTAADLHHQGINPNDRQRLLAVPLLEPQQSDTVFGEERGAYRQGLGPCGQGRPHTMTKLRRQRAVGQAFHQWTAGKSAIHARHTEIAAPRIALRCLQRHECKQPLAIARRCGAGHFDVVIFRGDQHVQLIGRGRQEGVARALRRLQQRRLRGVGVHELPGRGRRQGFQIVAPAFGSCERAPSRVVFGESVSP